MSSGSQTDSSVIEERLRAGEVALKTIRQRVAVLGLTIGLALSVIYIGLLVSSLRKQHRLAEAAMIVCFCCRFLFCNLAPLAGDKTLVLVVMLIEASSLLVELSIQFLSPEQYWYREHSLRLALNVTKIGIFFVGIVVAACCKTAEQVNAAMWRTLQVFFAYLLIKHLLVIDVISDIEKADTFSKDFMDWMWLIGEAMTLALLCWQSELKYLQGCLHGMASSYSTKRSAAGVAALICGRDVHGVLENAKSRFRCIRVDELTREDFDQSTATRATTEGRAQPCKLGDCDAFFSHSWHDSSNDKWEALQLWRTAFVEENLREPRIWFDKACIDQSNIEADLCGLPVFLAGCQKLVVCLGLTYLERLWCVIELFTYIHMGGAIDNVVVLPLIGKPNAEDIINQFNGLNCKCSVAEDKIIMLRIIELAFGDITKFNVVVRRMLDKMLGVSRDKMLQGLLRRDSSSSGSLSSTGEEWESSD